MEGTQIDNGKRLVSLLPYALLIQSGGEAQRVEPSGEVATVNMTIPMDALAKGAEAFAKVVASGPNFSPVQNLPAPQQGVYYVARALVAEAAARQGRTDVITFVPAGSPVVVGDALCVSRFVRY